MNIKNYLGRKEFMIIKNFLHDQILLIRKYGYEKMVKERCKE